MTYALADPPAPAGTIAAFDTMLPSNEFNVETRGCPCPGCTRHTRDYISYLSRGEELTAVRLIVLHNLTYMRELTTHARRAIEQERFEPYRQAVLAGTPPWSA